MYEVANELALPRQVREIKSSEYQNNKEPGVDEYFTKLPGHAYMIANTETHERRKNYEEKRVPLL